MGRVLALSGVAIELELGPTGRVEDRRAGAQGGGQAVGQFEAIGGKRQVFISSGGQPSWAQHRGIGRRLHTQFSDDCSGAIDGPISVGVSNRRPKTIWPRIHPPRHLFFIPTVGADSGTVISCAHASSPVFGEWGLVGCGRNRSTWPNLGGGPIHERAASKAGCGCRRAGAPGWGILAR